MHHTYIMSRIENIMYICSDPLHVCHHIPLVFSNFASNNFYSILKSKMKKFF